MLDRNKWTVLEIERMKNIQLADPRNQLISAKIKLYMQTLRDPECTKSLKQVLICNPFRKKMKIIKEV
jgi:hypothetical protein